MHPAEMCVSILREGNAQGAQPSPLPSLGSRDLGKPTCPAKRTAPGQRQGPQDAVWTCALVQDKDKMMCGSEDRGTSAEH